LIYLLIDLTN